MYDNKKLILHLVFDGVLFDKVYPSFESMDNYNNLYLLGRIGTDKQLKYIGNKEAIIQVDTIEEWGNIVSDPRVDYIYLHGLWQDYLKALDYIRKDVVVLWWCFGMEIYEACLGWPPLLPMKLYKPRTHWCYLRSKGITGFIPAEVMYSCPKMYTLIRTLYDKITGRVDDNIKLFSLFLSRIDYAFTPLELELTVLKQKHPFIKAKPFRLRGSIKKEPLVIHNETGDILLEHSANITNNHLDIIASIKKKRLSLYGRDVFIPLSYGSPYIAKKVKDKALFDGANVHCLMEPLPLEAYTEKLAGCTHAFFGMMRQSGLGNIYFCFRKGIKVFFYKDSFLYKHFKASGFQVFSIEDDLNDMSLSTSLEPWQAKNNYDKFFSFYDPIGTFQQQFDNIFT